MSKVVRISGPIFKRLQQLAEPLVDTPASVIERVLDHYEECVLGEPVMDARVLADRTTSQSFVESASLSYAGAQKVGESLFLAPASEENVAVTIEKGVPLDVARKHLESSEFKRLQQALGARTTFKCWAMTEAKRSTYAAMKPGDTVLLAVKGTGLFGYGGTILTTVESKELGNELWPVRSGSAWSLIYVFDDVEPIEVSKKKAVRVLGYSPNFVVPGVIRVDPRLLTPLVQQYGSIKGFLGAITKSPLGTAGGRLDSWPGRRGSENND